ncbi:hypothetical protein SAMN05444266_10622 [Chitinophaga jiangningensis]|uniref:Uncharacterized protein n=1 Tax=Chitinophaga jiangningensis TaxID=1419482 RepID=A0A1M7F7B7_9BACT|nr:hypothetical protein [Chitinophaga jiangningensis]SHL99916.1 hypothetical protein SAMN05444266_10622 [Chitinophaga jiangningensis]
MESILKYTGIAGLAITLAFLLFRSIIKRELFPTMTKKQGYNILRLIIAGIFTLSVLCIVLYFYKQAKDTPTTTSPTTGSKSSDNHGTVIGDVISAETVSINKSELPEYNGDFANNDFEFFLDKNNGRTIFIDMAIGAQKFDSSRISDEYLYEEPTYIQLMETTHKIYTEGGHYVDSDVKKLKFCALHSPQSKIYWKNLKQKDWDDEHIYYELPPGFVTVTLEISDLNKGMVQWNRGTIYIRGQYKVIYQLGGQGYNFATLRPI